MSNTSIKTPDALPFVTTDEGGDMYYGEGHIDPWRFTLAVVLDIAINVAADDAIETLLGPKGWNYTDRNDHAIAFVRKVKHSWYKPDPHDDERMDPCAATDDGAVAFTEVDL